MNKTAESRGRMDGLMRVRMSQTEHTQTSATIGRSLGLSMLGGRIGIALRRMPAVVASGWREGCAWLEKHRPAGMSFQLPQMPARRRRVSAFFDGRNARGAAAKAFQCDELANFNPRLLARQVCEAQGWQLASVSYYIGLPGEGRLVRGESREDWEKRLGHWRRHGVRVVTRPLSGRNKEKGIDVRLALDMAQQFRRGQYEVALIFSQDQDFQEIVEELRELARLEGRRIQTVCAFPGRVEPKFNRGIDNVDQTISLSKDVYAQSLEGAGTVPVRRRILGIPIPDYRPIPFAFAAYLGVAVAVFLTFSIQQGLRAPSPREGAITAVLNMGSNGAAAVIWPSFAFEKLFDRDRSAELSSVVATEEGPQSGGQEMAEQTVSENHD